MTALVLQPQSSQLVLPKFEPKHWLCIDYETFFDEEYTLRKMTNAAYVRDARFETIGVGVFDGEETAWMEHEEFAEWAKTVPWHETAWLSHHAQFDALIASHHYNIHPAFIACTMSMARSYGIDGGVSLKNLGVHFGIGAKGDEVEKARGKRRRDFTQEEWLRYGEYCKQDVALCNGIFNTMLAGDDTEEPFPESELWVVDATVRSFTEPKLFINEPMLKQYLQEEQEKKKGLLARIEADRSLVMSNDKFAAELRGLGIEPGTKRSKPRKDGSIEDIYAFAKSDIFMQEILEHEDDDVRFLAEARVALKSTINETRTERLMKLGRNDDGSLRPCPVYYLYYGAHTGRQSGGDRMNFQNFERTNKKNPRKGILRKALLAPAGHKTVAADSGQIEARITAWLAGHERLLQAFREKRDVYSETASVIYNRPVDRKKVEADEIPGQVGKVCLAGDALVLTERGWVPIVEVRQTDRVWDGVEWTGHQGISDNGVKEVWSCDGVSMTSDHQVLTQAGWKQWAQLLESHSLFRSALESATLPSLDGSTFEADPGVRKVGIRMFDVSAETKAASTDRIYFEADRQDATPARSWHRVESDGGSTRTFWPTMRRALASSTDSLHASLVATTRRIARTVITVVEVLKSPSFGAVTEPLFFPMSRLCPAGTMLSSSSIAPTTTEVTNPATYASPQNKRTFATNDRWETSKTECSISKRRTRVYDLLSCGSRMRFTVLTERGPLLVHNCVLGFGYQQGWETAAQNFLKGVQGAPPMSFGWAEVEATETNVDRFKQDERKMERVEKILSRLSHEDLVVHCAVTDKIVRKWRELNEPIVDFWRDMEDALEGMLDADANYTFGPGECLRVVRHAIVLPNGMKLRYPGLNYDEEGGLGGRGGFTYLGRYGKIRKHIYGGALTENIVQALARIVVFDQMNHVRAVTGYAPTLVTHDEITIVAPDAYASWILRTLKETMVTPPTWASGLPLSVEGGFSYSYGLAK